MNHSELQVWLDNDRGLTVKERQVLAKLLESSFRGRDILVEQARNARVIGYCNCGCKSVTLSVPHAIGEYPYKVRVPVEMIVYPKDEEVPVVILLHVVKGYIDELEVFNADSSPLLKWPEASKTEIAIDPSLQNSGDNE